MFCPIYEFHYHARSRLFIFEHFYQTFNDKRTFIKMTSYFFHPIMDLTLCVLNNRAKLGLLPGLIRTRSCDDFVDRFENNGACRCCSSYDALFLPLM